MSKKVLFFLLLIVPVSFTVKGQKRNNIWVFGDHAGINFNTTPPSAIDTTAVTTPDVYNYHTASICDANGNLLFYTDGITVWDTRNARIQRYLGRWPWSLYTIPLICPYPGNDSLYYIFGVSSGSYANRLQYLTINMKGNSGRGEIVYPQPSTLSNYFKILLTNASILLAGTAHCNEKDTWIISYSDNAFYSFLVTKNGVDSIPVISKIPLALQNYKGNNIKFSASGEKLVFPQKDNNQIVVLSFNKATGVFSNPVTLNIPQGHLLEDVEISPDGSKLYFGSYTLDINGDDGETEWHYIYQMNLNEPTPASIEKSIFAVTPSPLRVPCNERICYVLHRVLQLAPDGAIYTNLVNTVKLTAVIEAPNEAGVKSRYAQRFLDLKRLYKSIRYNYIRSGSYTPKENMIQVQKKPCSDQSVQFSLLYQDIDSVRWNFGDPAAGGNNFSSSFKPAHTYPSPGNYNVSVVLFSPCFMDTARTVLTITNQPSVQLPSFADTTICTGSSYIVNATVPVATKYQWENGSVDPVRKIDAAGYYRLQAFNDCSVDTTSFTVKVQPCDCTFFVPTAFTPNNDGLNDKFKPVSKCFAKDYQFRIYNRYGGLVFSSSQYSLGWDGTIEDMPAGSGTFIWTLQYRDPNNNQLFKKNGSVTLIR